MTQKYNNQKKIKIKIKNRKRKTHRSPKVSHGWGEKTSVRKTLSMTNSMKSCPFTTHMDTTPFKFARTQNNLNALLT